MKRAFFALLFVMFFAQEHFAQRNWAAMQVDHVELAPGIHRLFIGNTVSMVAYDGPEGLLLIDAAYEQTVNQVRDTLKRISDKPVRYLINTHLHADHTGGNIEFGKGAEIISHHSVREWLASERKQGDRFPGPMPAHALPTVTFDGNMHLHYGGQTIELYHLPGGQTLGDVIIYFPASKVLVVGDLLFADNFPFIDTSQGGNLLVFLKNLYWIADRFPSEVNISGGHGPVYTMTQFRNWIVALETSISVISDAKASGMSADEIKKAKLLAKWADYGKFFITEERWIDTVYPAINPQ